MIASILGWAAAFALLALAIRKLHARLLLSRAKHRSLAGHPRISKVLARLAPFYEYGPQDAFASDGADAELAGRRRGAFARLATELGEAAPETLAMSEALEPYVPDLQFTSAYRVPFQYRRLVSGAMRPEAFAVASDGVRLQNADGRWSYDLGGSYGVNLLGYDFYKSCIREASAEVDALGPVLGPYHPLTAENVRMLREISGLDQISFHMSGTEAVMQAVALARYHTGRSRSVQFCGAYHGWWDGVQPGVGSQRRVRDVYVLEELSETTLQVLRTRMDIACVLVNPLQALHPNRGASNDAMLLAGNRDTAFDREAHSRWLQRLRQVCDEAGIVLIFDEVFVGFRLARGGAQEYFGVQADMVTYGKTLGGGLPVGVLCGRAELMQRYRPDRPTDICFARGTFNSHPYVMATMNGFLRHTLTAEYAAAVESAGETWDERRVALNERLVSAGLPIRFRNLASIWVLVYLVPSRYNWMLQYYLRAEGLSLAWVGTARFIFSHNYTAADFETVADRIVRAAERMQADGWWTVPEELTNGEIGRRVTKEMLLSMIGAGRRRRRSAGDPEGGELGYG